MCCETVKCRAEAQAIGGEFVVAVPGLIPIDPIPLGAACIQCFGIARSRCRHICCQVPLCDSHAGECRFCRVAREQGVFGLRDVRQPAKAWAPPVWKPAPVKVPRPPKPQPIVCPPGQRKLFSIGERDGWKCWLCRRPVDRSLAGQEVPGAPTRDHVVPASLGGSNARHNLRLAHRRCNIARGIASPEAARYAGRFQLSVAEERAEDARDEVDVKQWRSSGRIV